MSIAIAKAVFDQAFAPGREPRSEAYKAGALHTLRHRLEGVSFPSQLYPAGSAERDAYFAGADEGRALADKAKEEALNYDPADPEKMRLPAGITCGNCVHIRRCSQIYGHTETDTYCDWSPSRFRAAAASPKGAPA